MKCHHDKCLRDAESRGWCGAHYMRWKRGSPLDRPIKSIRVGVHQQLLDAALAVAEAEGEAEYAKAWSALRHAAKRYAFAGRPVTKSQLQADPRSAATSQAPMPHRGPVASEERLRGWAA